MTSFFGELKRRNVVKVAVAYAIVGWVLIEVTTTVLPTFEAPAWVLQTITFVIILGFPLAVVLSWIFDLTPEGLERTGPVPVSGRVAKSSERKLDFAIIGALVLALGFVVYNYVLEDRGAVAVLPNSVAVLPFENLSLDPEDAFFASGIHEETLNQLAKLRNLSVISRTSMLRYADSDLSIPEIAEELNVQTVMEGSVRYAADRVRITAQLIDAATDEHLWSEVYERDFADIFAIQSDIAMNIANALEAEFSLEEQESIEKIPTRSVAAYELYLQATATGLDGRIAIDTAHSLLDRAIELDPEFALAYARRAGLYQNREAIDDAQKALSLDPNLPSAHLVLSLSDVLGWRWSEGRERLERALELAPNAPQVLIQYAWVNAISGQHDEAMRDAQRALALDPNDPGGIVHLFASYVYLLAGRDSEAQRIFREANEQNPTSYLFYAWLSRMLRGNPSEAEELALKAVEYYLEGGAGRHYVTYSLALAGLQDEAVRFDPDVDAPGPAGLRMMRALAHGDQQRALDVLNRTTETRSRYGYGLILLSHNVWRDPVLDRAEFVEARTRFRQALLE